MLLTKLKSCLERTCSEQDTRKELVFIKGYSGVGKSTLARTLEQSVGDMKNAVCVQGKFDLNKGKMLVLKLPDHNEIIFDFGLTARLNVW